MAKKLLFPYHNMFSRATLMIVANDHSEAEDVLIDSVKEPDDWACMDNEGEEVNVGEI